MATNATLTQVWGAERNKRLACVLLVVGGTMALWVSAKVQIPFIPVPMTMQTFVVLTIGMAFGMRLAWATLMGYLVEGAIGLPVFAGTPEKGLGLAYMMGPTGGYLLGFLLAAIVIGLLAERGFGRTLSSSLLAMTTGLALIYIPGLLWLGFVLGIHDPLKILAIGAEPYALAEVLKLAMASLMFPALWRWTESKIG